MTEYGILLEAGIVAPCASPQVGQAYALGRNRTMVARQGDDDEWRALPIAVVLNIPAGSQVKDPCRHPCHGTLRRHEAAREPACATCRVFQRDYRRDLRRRKKEQAA